MDAISIIKDLFPYSYSVVSDDSGLALDIFKKYLNFKVTSYRSDAVVNGWIVPKNWSCQNAYITSKSGFKYDFKKNKLGVGVLSPSFIGVVTYEELIKKINFSPTYPNAVPYAWKNLYRPGQKEWELCISYNDLQMLPKEEYEVVILTNETCGYMHVLDFTKKGENQDTILFNAHNCHPFQANDDISGCAVAIFIFMQLMKRANTKYTYRLVIAPELIGPVHWLHALPETETCKFVGAIMLKSIGNDGDLKLQNSFSGDSLLDKAAHNVFATKYGDYISGPFRSIYGNDETVFDSPGYEIPSISLTRYPFDEYHTDMDTPDAISDSSVNDAIDTINKIIDAIEDCFIPKFIEKGLISLSNPQYDLYIPAHAPGLDKEQITEKNIRWNYLMNNLPREMNGKQNTLDIANKYSVDHKELVLYILKWVDKKLVVKLIR